MEKEQVNYSQINVQSETSVNAMELVWKYLHFGWLFALVLSVCFAGAWLYLRYTKPLYSVSSTLLIRNETNNRSTGMGTQDMFADIALFQSNTNKQNEILILSSRSMMERVVRSLGLEKAYSVVGNVKTIDIFREQPFDLNIINIKDTVNSFVINIDFNSEWTKFRVGKNQEEWSVGQDFELPQGKFRITPHKSVYSHLSFRDFTVHIMPLQKAAMYYRGGLEVKPANDLSNVLSLTYNNENPALATAIVNELMVQYNNATIEDKNEMNRKILTFIKDRLNLVDSQLDSVETNLEKYRTQKQVIDLPSQSEMYFGNFTQLTESIRQQQVQLEVVKLLEQYINQPSNRLSLVPSTLGLADPTLLELTAGYNRLVTERLKELQTGATLDNPFVKNLEKSIEEARVKILQSLANIKQVYQKAISSLNAQSGSVKREISSIPERDRQNRERAREQEIKQNLYLYLMQKREESEIAQASTISSSRIIDNALPVYKLVSPVPLKIYGIALLAGLLIPIVIIYIRDVLNDKVTTRGDISNATNAPVLVEIGHSTDNRVLLFPDSSRTIVAEQMRILRSNLRFVLGEKFDNPTILVTSSFSGEGKSFISTNLGATLAISGKKTVILEFDLRKPKILEGLGLPKSSGITNYLVGNASFEQLPQAVPQVNDLYVIPCGPVPPNPSEILLTTKVPELFKWLKENFDAIVIDTAPVGLVSDAFTLSQYADSTIYVVRQRYTFKRQLSFINELYRERKLPQMGLLVNDVVTEGSKSYYGYGSGRYGYGYGYGYAQKSGYYAEGKKKPGLRKKLKNIFS